jgi:hypothetical protein
MAKKKEPRKESIKTPVKGQQYYFLFAGGIVKGELGDRIPRLEEIYGERWYRMHTTERGREMRYPIALRNISEDPKDLQ